MRTPITTGLTRALGSVSCALRSLTTPSAVRRVAAGLPAMGISSGSNHSTDGSTRALGSVSCALRSLMTPPAVRRIPAGLPAIECISRPITARRNAGRAGLSGEVGTGHHLLIVLAVLQRPLVLGPHSWIWDRRWIHLTGGIDHPVCGRARWSSAPALSSDPTRDRQSDPVQQKNEAAARAPACAPPRRTDMFRSAVFAPHRQSNASCRCACRRNPQRQHLSGNRVGSRSRTPAQGSLEAFQIEDIGNLAWPAPQVQRLSTPFVSDEGLRCQRLQERRQHLRGLGRKVSGAIRPRVHGNGWGAGLNVARAEDQPNAAGTDVNREPPT